MEESKKLTYNSINWYPGHMAKAKRQIIENLKLIDVVYEVIDARMPYSSKIRDIDDYIKNKHKILIMTKKDLCDIRETEKWQKYYEDRGYKVFLTSLEKETSLKPLIKMTEELMQEENIKREMKGLTKRKTRILVMGIPNVGKSTLINRLVGRNVSLVGNTPGVTKQLSWIRVNEQLELLDSPGILWPKLDEEIVAYNLASLTAIKETILPLDDVVLYILKRLYQYYPSKLKERYNIDYISDDTYEQSLVLIGTKRGCLVRGGIVDYDKVYSVVINDLKNGIIKGITFDRCINE